MYGPTTVTSGCILAVLEDVEVPRSCCKYIERQWRHGIQINTIRAIHRHIFTNTNNCQHKWLTGPVVMSFVRALSKCPGLVIRRHPW
jgi:hypothetical protein